MAFNSNEWLDPPKLIQANADSVSQTTLSTCLSSPDGAQVSTVEHLLSALSGMGIDNVLVEYNARKFPLWTAAPHLSSF